mmetsp:Transcript_7617/g.13337  ORF Transcript_7617/g.13337 Transcript_7617/m.13337 type:complete len:124 (+) Transcript_7617:2608-2979(+)
MQDSPPPERKVLDALVTQGKLTRPRVAPEPTVSPEQVASQARKLEENEKLLSQSQDEIKQNRTELIQASDSLKESLQGAKERKDDLSNRPLVPKLLARTLGLAALLRIFVAMLKLLLLRKRGK